MGTANLYVIYNFSTNTWVNFKLFGVLGLTMAFVIVQAIYLARHIEPDQVKELDWSRDKVTAFTVEDNCDELYADFIRNHQVIWTTTVNNPTLGLEKFAI